MKLFVFTIVLDGMPFLPNILKSLEETDLDWEWVIAEGAARNVLDTGWCKPIDPRFSRDGTSEWINRAMNNSRLRVYRKQIWHGKLEMCNKCVSQINEPCVLLQCDSDEYWSASQLHAIVEAFDQNILLDQMSFICRYFVGRDIVINVDNELLYTPFPWTRAWRFQPGMKFFSHEPPVLMPHPRRTLSIHETHKMGLIFDHYSYVTEAQVAFKEKFYGYPNAVTHWRRLQTNTQWPAQLSKFLPWAGKNSIAERIKL